MAPVRVRVILMTMTLKVRRVLLNILLVPGFAALGFVILCWIAWSRGLYPGDYSLPELTMVWWGVQRHGTAPDLLWAMAGLSVLTAVPLAFELILRRWFGRSPSPEMFFLRLFILTLPLQALRLIVPLALSGSLDVYFASGATRVAWFARLAGAAAVLNIGLYSGEIPFQRSGAILGAGTLAAVAIAVMIPLDSTQVLGNMLIRAGSETSLAMICVTTGVLAVLSLVGTAFTQQKSRYYLLAMMLLFIVTGADLMFFTAAPVLIPGGLLLTAGILGFSREIRNIYLWV